MPGIDTNVLVRFLTRDDPVQFQRAQKIIERDASAQNPIFISLVVLLETEWVLRSRYELTKSEILATFSDLLSSYDLRFEDDASVEEALHTWKNSTAQFADCLIAARHRACGCRATASFDAGALGVPGMVPA
ncbi:MAG TPA: type II toxin-antitoxin system VapC family toxin [Steroidobacteraceae bacterium]